MEVEQADQDNTKKHKNPNSSRNIRGLQKLTPGKYQKQNQKKYKETPPPPVIRNVSYFLAKKWQKCFL